MSAKDALAKLEHRKEIEAQVLKLIQDIPHTEILLSMPGIGPRSAAQILMTVGDMSDFPDIRNLPRTGPYTHFFALWDQLRKKGVTSSNDGSRQEH